MLIRKKLPRAHGLNEPILHADHARPVSRRDFISSGLITGPAVIAATGVLGMLARSGMVHGQTLNDLSPKIRTLRNEFNCNIQDGKGKIPFICFDLAGGANLNGSEMLIGNRGGQLDFLSTAGYARLGLPGDMVPNAPNAAAGTNSFISQAFGAAWHSDGAILRGMLERTSPATQALTNGCAIAARSENDTGNNPHNPMYGILKAGAGGELLNLIGSQASDSGGNSLAPMSMIDLQNRPTKVDRASDVTGLVDTGELGRLGLPQRDINATLEAMTALSGGTGNGDPNQQSAQEINAGSRLARVDYGVARAPAIQSNVRCAYVRSADLANKFSDASSLNPALDEDIVGTGGIFSQAEYDGDGEFRKTAAIMKMVMNGYAAAGTITMGGYDYHDGTRATGEVRNLRAGRCIGACLEYARRLGKPVMIYVFSDGSLNAMSTIDNTANGRGKFSWQGDNQSVANSFFLVFNPTRRPMPVTPDPSNPDGLGKQIGYYRADGSVETSSHPGANAVNLLVETVVLNYMALHNEAGRFTGPGGVFTTQGLGGQAMRDSLVAFAPICNGVITSPI